MCGSAAALICQSAMVVGSREVEIGSRSLLWPTIADRGTRSRHHTGFDRRPPNGHYPCVQLHLVGGFLGSGKTTAIGSACELLRRRGRRPAVVTNDQGEVLVDTRLLAGAGIPTAEVVGGCFCCRYPELVERIAALAAAGAEHLFAEAAGSCVDLVRTVLNPLLRRREVELEAVTLSVLADARLLADYLAGRPLPWTLPALHYLFERQLAEASLLVATKVDLLAPAARDRAQVAATGQPATEGDREQLAATLQAGFPRQRLLLQDSRTAQGVAGWLDLLEMDSQVATSGVEVDYKKYGAAEAALAWNDREVELSGVEGRATEAARAVIDGVTAALQRRRAAVGHLKFLVRDHYRDARVSITGADLPQRGDGPGQLWHDQLPRLAGDRVTMIVNARVEMDAADLERLIDDAVAAAASTLGHVRETVGIQVRTRSRSAFHPAYPEPVHLIKQLGTGEWR